MFFNIYFSVAFSITIHYNLLILYAQNIEKSIKYRCYSYIRVSYLELMYEKKSKNKAGSSSPGKLII